MIKVYWSQLNQQYFTSEYVHCDHCGEQLEKHFILEYAFRRKEASIRSFCIKCQLKGAPFGDVVERKHVIIVPYLPEDAELIPPIKPQLMNCNNMDVFQAATRQIQNERVIDHTKIAGRESFEGLSIGAPDLKRLEDLEKPTNEQIFRLITTASPIHQNKKLCGNNEQTKRLTHKNRA